MQRLFLASKYSVVAELAAPLLKPSARISYLGTAREGFDISRPDTDRQALVEQGYTVSDLTLSMNAHELRCTLEASDALFVAGGNLSYLGNVLYHTGHAPLLADIVRQGLLYIGSSAGSMIIAQDIEAVRRIESSQWNQDPVATLEMTDFLVLPHASRNAERYATLPSGRYERLEDTEAIVVIGSTRIRVP